MFRRAFEGICRNFAKGQPSLEHRSRRKRRRDHLKRSMLFEPLENRVLLTCFPSVTNPALRLAAIEGTVFEDFNANDMLNDPPDTVQVGVEVELFDVDPSSPGALACEATTTDMNGEYAFPDLPAGNYWVRQSPPPGFKASQMDPMTMAPLNVKTITITSEQADGMPGDTEIDAYNTFQAVNTPQNPADGNFASASLNNAGIIGGQREIAVTATTQVPGVAQNSVVNNATLTLNTPANGQGKAQIQYDGVDSLTPDDPLVLNPTGLGGVDLTAGGATGIRFTFRNDVPNSVLTIDVYSDADNWSQFTASIPQTLPTDPPEPVFLPFDDLSVFVPMGAMGGVDFTDVGAIEIHLEGAFEADISLTAFEPTVPVPVPVNFGNYQPASLGDFVWEDLNANGLQDPMEPGVPGATARLLDSMGMPALDADGMPVSDIVTMADGAYLFTNLKPGDYQVEFIPPADFEFSDKNVGMDDTIDSDPDPMTGLTDLVNLESGDEVLTVDAGLFQRAGLGDFVWRDNNRDGIQDAGEPGLNGVTVNLLDDMGMQIDTTTTANHPMSGEPGYYNFSDLVPGDYIVEFELPTGFGFTLRNQGMDDTVDSDADPDPMSPTFGQSPTVNLISGELDETIDAGLIPTRLGDFVWRDLNFNGIQDPGEPGINNVTVNLLDAMGTVVDTTTTGVHPVTMADGFYIFEEMAAGDYRVEFILPMGFAFTFPNEGGDDTVDSDADRDPDSMTFGQTPQVTLAAGDEDLTLDAGMFLAGRIGDFVWYDANRDGMQDVSENGIPNIGVWLTWAGPDGDFDTVADNKMFMTTTGADSINPDTTKANYLFDNLPAGNFRVEVQTGELPQGLIQSADPDSVFDSTSELFLNEAGVNLLQDFGYTDAPKEIFATSEEHTGQNMSGVDQLVPGEIIRYRLVASLPENDAMTAFLNYQFEDNLPGGLQYLNDGTTAIAFVSNSTIDSSGPGALPTMDGMGNPLNVAGSLDNLDMIIPTYILPASAIMSENGDQVFENGTNPIFTFGDLVNNDDDVDQEFVVLEFNALMLNFVNHDVPDDSGSNITDDGRLLLNDFAVFVNNTLETRSEKVPVTPVAPKVDDVAKNAIAFTETTVTYQVTFSSSGSATAFDVSVEDMLPAEVTLDLATVDIQTTGGASGVVDNSAGNVLSVTIGVFPVGATATVTYTADINPPDADGFDPINNTVEVCPTSLPGDGTDPNDTGSTTPGAAGELDGESRLCDDDDERLGVLGDFVWEDLNRNGIQDANEPGINGVTVNLLDGMGNPTGVSTTTISVGGNDGFYGFSALPFGDYIVEFILPTMLGDFSFTLQNEGMEDTLDSDADPDPMSPTFGQSQVVTLTEAEPKDVTIDAGMVQPTGLGDFVWHDQNFNGIQDAGEPGIPNVVVKLLDEMGTEIGMTMTDVDGLYMFDDLLPGTYSVQFELPADFIFTFQNQGMDDELDSDADRTTGETQQVTLLSGDVDLSLDAGMFMPGRIGDYVWLDVDGDGMQGDPMDEPGIENVGVWLTWAGPDMMFGTADDLMFMQDTAMVPGLRQNYLFDQLPGGNFRVEIHTNDLPAGLIQSADPDGVFDSMSELTLPEGGENLIQDFGYTNPPKEIVSTSEDHTGQNMNGVDELVPGEIVRYRLVASLPESTEMEPVLNYQFVDNLPNGLQYLNDGTTKVAFVSNNGVSSSTLPPTDGGGNSLNVAGSLEDLDMITPEYVLPMSAILSENGDLVFENGTNPIFSFGDLINADEDVNQEFVVLEFNALMLNFVNFVIPDEDGSPIMVGDTLNNDFDLFIDNSFQVRSNEIPVTPVAPEVDDVTKNAVSYQDGVVTFEVTFSSTGTATAFDVSVSDTLPMDLTLNVGSVNVQTTGGAAGVTDNSAGNTVSITIDEFPVGATATVTYTASVSDPDNFNTITNMVEVCPTSLPGGGTPENPTGSTPPGQTGTVDGESQLCDDDMEMLGAVGDFIWNDRNGDGVQDMDEPGIPNIPVKLLDENGMQIATDTTDADGIYGFAGLPAGKYTVMVDSSAFPHPVVERTFDPDGTNDDMTMKMLGEGEVDLTLDFGYRALIDLRITKESADLPGPCVPVEPDTTLDYTITVFNDGPNPVSGARIVDTFPPEALNTTWILQNSSGVQIGSGSGDIDTTVDIPANDFVVFLTTSPIDVEGNLQITNTATVALPDDPIFDLTDTNPDNNSATDTASLSGGDFDLTAPPEFLVGGVAEPGHPLLLRVTGASIPVAYVTFVVGTQLGSSPTPDGLNSWGIADPKFVTAGLSCVCGQAEAVYTVPEELAGQTIYFQAYEFRPEKELTEIIEVQVGTGNPLRASVAGSNGSAPNLTQQQLAAVFDEAVARWESQGLTAEQSAALEAISVQITDLPGRFLGRNTGTHVEIDVNAAGHGWFVDPTPSLDEEFETVNGDAELKTSVAPAAGRIDLLTTVMHEIGNVLGLGDIAVTTSGPQSLMTEFLDTGTRRLPSGELGGNRMAEDDSARTIRGKSVSIDVVENDQISDGVAVNIVQPPVHGDVSVSGEIVTYTPDANFSGIDSFQYTLIDGNGLESEPATVIVLVGAVADFHNADMPEDVDASGHITPIDVLLAINYFNVNGGQLPPAPAAGEAPAAYLDVDGDGVLTPTDIIRVINALNLRVIATGEGEGGVVAQAPADDATPVPSEQAVAASRTSSASTADSYEGLALLANQSAGVDRLSLGQLNDQRDAVFASLGQSQVEVRRMRQVESADSVAEFSLAPIDDLLGEIADDVDSAFADLL